MRYILDETIEECGDPHHYLDLSKFQLIMVNDTATVANGTTMMLRELKSPWKAGFYGEQFTRGQWIKKFERKFDDFCNHILTPTEVWYSGFKEKLKGRKCPYANGTVTHCNEDVIHFDVSFMPFTFQGRWRLTLTGDLGCYRVHFDLVDD